MTDQAAALSVRIVEICKRLHQRNMLAAADGNVSYKISDDEILITPTGIAKAFMDPNDMAVMNIKGDMLKGHPSGERFMHLTVYRNCPGARAVVHAHPPTAIAWSIARPELNELPANCMSELILSVGKIPIAPYARPGTEAMGDVLIPFLSESRVIILARHGALSCGEDLDEAYNGMERLEHAAQILKSAAEIGSLSDLPKSEIDELKALRARLGSRTL